MNLAVRVPMEEWTSARRLIEVVADDERSTLGQVRLRADGRRRSWYGTDSFRAASAPSTSTS